MTCSLAEHAVGDDAVANEVESNSQVIVVSLEEAPVELEVGEPCFEHVLEVVNGKLVLLSACLDLSQVVISLLLLLGED